jgi:hypothetical protein
MRPADRSRFGVKMDETLRDAGLCERVDQQGFVVVC